MQARPATAACSALPCRSVRPCDLQPRCCARWAGCAGADRLSGGAPGPAHAQEVGAGEDCLAAEGCLAAPPPPAPPPHTPLRQRRAQSGASRQPGCLRLQTEPMPPRIRRTRSASWRTGRVRAGNSTPRGAGCWGPSPQRRWAPWRAASCAPLLQQQQRPPARRGAGPQQARRRRSSGLPRRSRSSSSRDRRTSWRALARGMWRWQRLAVGQRRRRAARKQVRRDPLACNATAGMLRCISDTARVLHCTSDGCSAHSACRPAPPSAEEPSQVGRPARTTRAQAESRTCTVPGRLGGHILSGQQM